MVAPSVIENPGQGGGGGGGTFVRLSKSAEPATDNYVEYANFTSTDGLIGSGTIKNTGANTLNVKETVTDFFGVTSSSVTAVAAGNDLLISLGINLGTARPPYRDYKLEAQYSGGDTTFDMEIFAVGA